MITDELSIRARRLIAGQFRGDDLDRLYLDQRDKHHERESFREVGDFIAHRRERQKGLVTQIARDVFTSISVWSLALRGKRPTPGDIERAARANFRLATDAQLQQGCGLRRKAAKETLESAIRKFETGLSFTDQETIVLGYLGNRFIWKPALTDEQLIHEFTEVLEFNAVLSRDEAKSLAQLKSFITLHAITCMHGSIIHFDNSTSGELLAGFSNREKCLEVKVQIRFEDAPKPILAPICMFLTNLSPEENCEASLLAKVGTEWHPHVWQVPIELTPEGKLSALT